VVLELELKINGYSSSGERRKRGKELQTRGRDKHSW
jgi:hypothetical protein